MKPSTVKSKFLSVFPMHRRGQVARATFKLLALFIFSLFSHAAEVIPAVPEHRFNDYAGIARPETAERLERELTRFERETSNQFVVAIYPKMQSDSSLADYTHRVAQSWHVGQKKKDNGIVLFVFKENRNLHVNIGKGLETSMPDALCKKIIDEEIVPHFRTGDFDAGLIAGVRALMSAARGEYHGSAKP